MDKVMSARLDESVITLIDRLSRQLRVSKKELIEPAIRRFAEGLSEEEKVDIFRATCGAWQRRESAATLHKRARQTFERGMRRHAE